MKRIKEIARQIAEALSLDAEDVARAAEAFWSDSVDEWAIRLN